MTYRQRRKWHLYKRRYMLIAVHSSLPAHRDDELGRRSTAFFTAIIRIFAINEGESPSLIANIGDAHAHLTSPRETGRQ